MGAKWSKQADNALTALAWIALLTFPLAVMLGLLIEHPVVDVWGMLTLATTGWLIGDKITHKARGK